MHVFTADSNAFRKKQFTRFFRAVSVFWGFLKLPHPNYNASYFYFLLVDSNILLVSCYTRNTCMQQPLALPTQELKFLSITEKTKYLQQYLL